MRHVAGTTSGRQIEVTLNTLVVKLFQKGLRCCRLVIMPRVTPGRREVVRSAGLG